MSSEAAAAAEHPREEEEREGGEDEGGETRRDAKPGGQASKVGWQVPSAGAANPQEAPRSPPGRHQGDWAPQHVSGLKGKPGLPHPVSHRGGTVRLPLLSLPEPY